ncbi:YgaP family membrane protein [Rhodanobacter aciditrophus]|uniref:YgaP family membrane protein n=1 Tax=Rhodanobacter aciditrophus TaxID=1623218 RepID=UPI003CE9DD51
MNIDRIVLAFAGDVVLAGLALGYFVSPWWFLLVLAAGVDLLQSAFTGFCPLARLLARLGVEPGCAFPTHGDARTPEAHAHGMLSVPPDPPYRPRPSARHRFR